MNSYLSPTLGIKGGDAVAFSIKVRAWLLGALLPGLTAVTQLAAAAETPVPLGSAANFGVLAGSTVTSTGATVVNGDLGLWPGVAVVLAAPGTVTGATHVNDSVAAAAKADLNIAYNDAATRSAAPVTVAGNIGGQTLGPGLYRSGSSLAISAGDLTLDGQGDPNAVFIFQMGSTLTTTAGRQVVLIGGAQAMNVFWQVGSSATIGTASGMVGTILADQSITLQTGATLQGRALARNAAVTLDATMVTVPSVTPPVQSGGSGKVVAWGLNANGQTNVPADLTGVVALAAGAAYSVALKSNGDVVAWGLNDVGQSTVPFGLSNVIAIAAGGSHAVALKSDTTVSAWGNNRNNQTIIPPGLIGVRAISAGHGHTVILKSDGKVLAWGLNDFGEASVPAGLTGVKAIAAGGGHTLALKTNGTVVAWGADDFFRQSTIPAGLDDVIAIAAGGSHSLALRSNGTVVAWGNDLLGQSTVPAGLSGVIAIAAGEFHSLALKSDGTIVAWGLNDDRETAVPAGLGGVTAISAGWHHGLALIGPIIKTQPVAQTFTPGTDLDLSVGAVGPGLMYQWLFNGTNIVNATNAILHLASPTGDTAGSYRVVITSSAGGTTTSQEVALLSLSFGDVKFYAGMTLIGTVGQQFRVDYAEAVVSGMTNWLPLTTFTLPASPYLVIDPNSPAHTQRFYRAVPLP